MGLETGTFIDDLVTTNPPSNDLVSQGDDHLRLLKEVLKNTFPFAGKEFRFPDVDGDNGDQTFDSSCFNLTFFVDTSGGAATLTLPSLAGSDRGWFMYVIKSTSDTNPMFIQPPSGSIRSGVVSVSKARRAIPFVRTCVFWDGGTWTAERCIGMPVGSIIPYAGADLSPGYEWPNGQTLSSAANYPEYFAVRGGLTTPDLRGRGMVGKDDMGGSAAGRVTSSGSGIDGVTLEANGGAQNVALSTGEMPSHSHSGTTGGQSNSHTHTQIASVSVGSYSGGGSNGPLGNNSQTGPASADHTHSFTTSSVGSGDAHTNMPPTMIENFLLVVE